MSGTATVRLVVGSVVAVLVAAVLVAANLLVAPPAAAAVAPGVTQRVSVLDDGSQATAPDDVEGGGVQDTAVSSDGRYAVFDDSIPLDPLTQFADRSQESDVYARDLRQPGHTVLISRGVQPGAESETGNQEVAADGQSDQPSVSATGRYVAFETDATNLPDRESSSTGGSGGDSGSDSHIVICDRDPDGDGVFDERDPDGAMDYRYLRVGRSYGDDESDRQWANYAPTISSDGSTVAWLQREQVTESENTTVVVVALGKDGAGRLQPPSPYAYRDLVPLYLPGAQSVGVYSAPAVSGDGRFAAFSAAYRPALEGTSSAGMTRARGLPPNDDTTPPTDPAFPTSPTSPPTQPVGSCADSGGCQALEVADLNADTVTRLDVTATGVAQAGEAIDPAISADGHVVAYTERAPDEEQRDQVIAVNRDPDGDGRFGPGDGQPIVQTTVSRNASGGAGAGDQPAVSGDGRYVAFESDARDMHDGVDREQGDSDPDSPYVLDQIVVRDLVVDLRREAGGLSRLPGALASPATDRTCAAHLAPDQTCAGDQASYTSALSGDGGLVAYASGADDLVAEDTNELGDAFVRTFQPTAQAAGLDFGTVPAGGSGQMSVTVRQAGFGPRPIGAVTVTGGDASQFSVFPAETCQGVTLYETDTCVVSIRFAPGAGSGRRSARLRVELPGSATPLLVPLTGAEGAETNGFQASPDPLLFPGERLALSTSGPAVITIGNASQSPYLVRSVTSAAGPNLYPGDYLVVSDTCSGRTLAAGATCRLDVVDNPHGAGLRPGALRVDDSATGGPHLIGLLATGATPALQISPSVVPSGRVGQVTGQGFPASHQVDVTVPGLNATAPISVLTGSDGRFSAPLVVFQHASIGAWTALASALGTDLRATAPVLVVLGTFEPPDFSTRN